MASDRALATHRGLVRSLADGRGEAGIRCRAERCPSETEHGAEDQAAGKLEESSKHQAPSTREIPNTKQFERRAVRLELDVWCFSGAWSLELLLSGLPFLPGNAECPR